MTLQLKRATGFGLSEPWKKVHLKMRTCAQTGGWEGLIYRLRKVYPLCLKARSVAYPRATARMNLRHTCHRSHRIVFVARTKRPCVYPMSRERERSVGINPGNVTPVEACLHAACASQRSERPYSQMISLGMAAHCLEKSRQYRAHRAHRHSSLPCFDISGSFCMSDGNHLGGGWSDRLSVVCHDYKI